MANLERGPISHENSSFVSASIAARRRWLFWNETYQGRKTPLAAALVPPLMLPSTGSQTMASKSTPLPHWTWEDLEAALDLFSPMGANDPVRSHLMRGLTDDAERAEPRELLQQVLSAIKDVGVTPEVLALKWFDALQVMSNGDIKIEVFGGNTRHPRVIEIREQYARVLARAGRFEDGIAHQAGALQKGFAGPKDSLGDQVYPGFF